MLEMSIGKGKAQGEFLVIKGKGVPPLCKDTTMKLGVLRVGVHIVAVAEPSRHCSNNSLKYLVGLGS